MSRLAGLLESLGTPQSLPFQHCDDKSMPPHPHFKWVPGSNSDSLACLLSNHLLTESLPQLHSPSEVHSSLRWRQCNPLSRQFSPQVPVLLSSREQLEASFLPLL